MYDLRRRLIGPRHVDPDVAWSWWEKAKSRVGP